MQYIGKLTFLFLLLFNCKSETNLGGLDSKPPLTDVLTLELTFGAENLPDEYLLAGCRGIAVNDTGDIFIVDENRIKVFDKNGKAKTIFGGSGQGPREFDYAGKPMMSPSGYLSVGNRTYFFNIFDNNNKFIYKLSFITNPLYRQLKRDNEWSIIAGLRVYSLTENQRIVFLQGIGIMDINRILVSTTGLLVYDKGDTLIELARYYLESEHAKIRASIIGNILPGDRVVFMEPHLDKVVDETQSNYILHIISIKDLKTSEIYHPIGEGEIIDLLVDRYYIFVISRTDNSDNDYLT